MKLPDSVRRAVRTYLDALLGTFLGLWAAAGIGATQLPGVADLAVIGKLALAAAIASVPALVSFVKNELEDRGAIPALLKAPSSDGADPVPDDGDVVTPVKRRVRKRK